MSVTSAARKDAGARRVRERPGQRAVDRQPRAVGQGPALAGFGTYLVATILITASLVFYVFLRVGSLQLGYQLSHERSEQLKIVHENRALRTEIGTLSAPARIRRLAASALGMVPAEHIVDLSEGAR